MWVGRAAGGAGVGALRGVCGGGGGQSRPVGLGAWLDLDAEAVGFDGQRLFQFQLIAVEVEEVEAAQDQTQGERRFVHGEAAADAGALAVAERLERPGGPLAFRLGREVLGVKHIRAGSPYFGIALQPGRSAH